MTETVVTEVTSATVRKGEAPVVLYDGACPLCSAWVAWVIERDPRGRFRFASLQSRIGLEMLPSDAAARAGAESVVLIDEDGVHVRSDAVLRIARRLGLPGAPLAATAVLPRSLRDAVYDGITFRRYGWFGRQNACSAPPLRHRARFLDAEEWAPARDTSAGISSVVASTGSPGGTRAHPDVGRVARPGEAFRAVARLAQRWFLSYFALYIGLDLFPLWAIPGTERFLEPVWQLRQDAVTWLANAVWNIRITVYPAGSGDTTYNYVEVLVTAALALVVAAAWTLVQRGSPVAPPTRSAIATYVRYFVASAAITYGWLKVFPLQFPPLGPDRLLATYETTSPMGILWNFMGSSIPYQVFAGLSELGGGILMLFRRTATVGALVCAAVLLNVVLLNFCYDVPVKLYSMHLLLMSLWLAAPQFVRLAGLLIFNLPTAPETRDPAPVRGPAWSWMMRLLKAGLIVVLIAVPAVDSYNRLRSERHRQRTAVHGIFRVESFSRGGVTGGDNPDSLRWVRVGIDDRGSMSILRADGLRPRRGFKLDTAQHRFVMPARDSTAAPSTFTYSEPEPDVLVLEGSLDSVVTTARMRRVPASDVLLTSRGFHWINERPFNR